MSIHQDLCVKEISGSPAHTLHFISNDTFYARYFPLNERRVNVVCYSMNNLYVNPETPALSPSFADVAAGVDRSSGERSLFCRCPCRRSR